MMQLDEMIKLNNDTIDALGEQAEKLNGIVDAIEGDDDIFLDTVVRRGKPITRREVTDGFDRIFAEFELIQAYLNENAKVLRRRTV